MSFEMKVNLIFVIFVCVLNPIKSVDFCRVFMQNDNKIDYIIESDVNTTPISHSLVVGKHLFDVKYDNRASKPVVTYKKTTEERIKADFTFHYLEKITQTTFTFWICYYNEDNAIIYLKSKEMDKKITNIWFNSSFKPTIAFSPSHRVEKWLIFFTVKQDWDKNKYKRVVKIYAVDQYQLVDVTKEKSEFIPKFIYKLKKINIDFVLPFRDIKKYAIIIQHSLGPKYCFTSEDEFESPNNECQNGKDWQYLVDCENPSPTVGKHPTTDETSSYSTIIIIISLIAFILIIILIISCVFFGYEKFKSITKHSETTEQSSISIKSLTSTEVSDTKGGSTQKSVSTVEKKQKTLK